MFHYSRPRTFSGLLPAAALYVGTLVVLLAPNGEVQPSAVAKANATQVTAEAPAMRAVRVVYPLPSAGR